MQICRLYDIVLEASQRGGKSSESEHTRLTSRGLFILKAVITVKDAAADVAMLLISMVEVTTARAHVKLTMKY